MLRFYGAAILVQLDGDPGGNGGRNLVATQDFWAIRGVEIHDEECSHVPGYYGWAYG
jgi:hypothetical protein